MTETGMSPADFAALNGNNCNDGMFGSGAWWIIVLFLFMWGRNGWGNGNGDSSGAANGYVLATDFANIERKLDGINKRYMRQYLCIK